MNDIYKIELKNSNSEYIGITLENGDPKVIFPRGYSLSSNPKSDALLLIKVFDKYIKNKSSKGYIDEEMDLCSGSGNNFSISNAIWLLNDYERNGLYKEFIHKYKIDKAGIINWPRTVKSITPYINNNNLIYLDFIIKEKKDNISNIILLIQKYIIKKCIDSIGWLYPNITLNDYNDLPYSRNICINLLRKEFQLINIDQTKKLLKHMISFLENDGDEKNNKSLKEYKTKFFYNIWEDMLLTVLGNEDPSKYYAKATWDIDSIKTNASNLRPDVILKKHDKIYVLDAKYYKYGITKDKNHLPQSSDITKQLMYSDYIKKSKGLDAYDAFIIPYRNCNSEIFKFVGNAQIDTNLFQYKKVVCILADVKTIMEQYIQMNKTDNLKETVIDIIDNENLK